MIQLCGARLTRPQEPLMWRSPLITFPRTSLLLILTVGLHRTTEQARAAHPIPNLRVRCLLAKLVPRCGITNTYCYHITAIKTAVRREFTIWWDSRRPPVLDTCPRHRHHTSCMIPLSSPGLLEATLCHTVRYLEKFPQTFIFNFHPFSLSQPPHTTFHEIFRPLEWAWSPLNKYEGTRPDKIRDPQDEGFYRLV